MLPLLLLLLIPALADEATDRQALVRGVPRLERLGIPGTIVLSGEGAFALFVAGDSPEVSGAPEAMLAAAHFGQGRVVAVAHGAYLQRGALDQPGVRQWHRNALRWLGGSRDALSIGLIGNDPELVEHLRERGHQVEPNVRALEPDSFDLLIWLGGVPADAGFREQIRTFVHRGGGLLTGTCPWGWEQINARRGLTLRDDLPENQVLAPMGLVFSPGYAEPNLDGGFRPAKEAVHAGRAFEQVRKAQLDNFAESYLLERALQSLPPSDTVLLPKLRRAFQMTAARQPPVPEAPLDRSNPLARLSVIWHSQTWKELAPEEVKPATGSDEYPGAVPKSARRVPRELALDPAIAGWQGVGLYVPPGEVIEIEAAGGSEWSAQVGCHTDQLFHHKSWRRWPEISHRVTLKDGVNRIATPFGGTLFFEAGRRKAQPLKATVRGAVAAPRFVIGDADSRKDWKRNRKAPGPWAELEGEALVLSLPSESIRDLDNPTAVVQYWDAVLRSHCELAGTPLPTRRERLVADVQISAGYMHAGYPIMTHLDVVTAGVNGRPAPLLDLESLKTLGNWGYFHELGHNRQRPAWTFGGTGEVTCNLFSLYTSQTMAGIEPWDHSWLQGQKAAGWKHLEAGAPFEQWKQNPGIALLMYAQLQRTFGWQPFRQVLAEYEQLERGAEPRTDPEKIDQWMLRMSLACGRDLRAFFLKWGLPLGAAIRQDQRLTELPEWLPDFTELQQS